MMRLISALALWTFLGVLLSGLFSSCTKNIPITTPGAGLEFSMDTLTFDTVFTALGNATRRFKVYNPHKQTIRINNARLEGGDGSVFKINIDGAATVEAENIDIPANDSIYVFATVYIDPSVGDAIQEDRIVFDTDGGGEQQVTLYAYGWNANYIGRFDTVVAYTNSILTLSNAKPTVFVGVVVFDNNSCLEIPAGAEVFMYGGPSTRPTGRATIVIGRNSCIRSNVGGDLNNPVEFKTHRLEEDYQLITFHHGGIVLTKESRDNIIDGTIIRNALDGVVVDSGSVNGAPKLRMNNSKIFNVERSCILSIEGDIEMTNTILANSNQYNFIGLKGGKYNFRHCTFANYATGLVRRSEAIFNYRDYQVIINDNGEEEIVLGPSEAYFTNCIIYGNRTEEIEIDHAGEPQPDFQYAFTNCLIKSDTVTQNLFNCLTNQDPLFAEPEAYNFQIDSTSSPANNAGTPNTIGGLSGPFRDATGRTREVNQPAIGAYAIPN